MEVPCTTVSAACILPVRTASTGDGYLSLKPGDFVMVTDIADGDFRGWLYGKRCHSNLQAKKEEYSDWGWFPVDVIRLTDDEDTDGDGTVFPGEVPAELSEQVPYLHLLD